MQTIHVTCSCTDASHTTQNPIHYKIHPPPSQLDRAPRFVFTMAQTHTDTHRHTSFHSLLIQESQTTALPALNFNSSTATYRRIYIMYHDVHKSRRCTIQIMYNTSHIVNTQWKVQEREDCVTLSGSIITNTIGVTIPGLGHYTDILDRFVSVDFQRPI